MGLVGAFLAAKVHRRIARIIIMLAFITGILGLEALLAGPGIDERAVHREMLI